MKKNEKKGKKVKAVKKTELQKVMENVGEQLAEAIKKSRKVLKRVKCNKQQLEMFAKTKEMSDRLAEAQKLFDDMRRTMWTKIEKDLKINSKDFKNGKVSLHFIEDKGVIEVVEDNMPAQSILGGVINLNK